MRVLAAIAFAALLICVGVIPGHAADRRVALVIGNDAYQAMPRLRNPVRDASEVEATLRRLGFATTKLVNADARALNDGLKRFAQSAVGAEAVFVFYSGHGAQLDGRTWLLPVDARLEMKEDVNDADLLALDRILGTLRDKSAVRIVVLDACRDNPVVDTLNLKIAEAQGLKGATLTKGLGRPLTALGDLVVYATQAGAVAADGDSGNSPFTESLLRHLETSDLDVRQMFFRVQEDVARRYKQLPEVSNSIIGEFKLKVAAVTSRPEVVAAPIGEAERTWPFVKDTTSVAVLEDYIRRYGDTMYGTLARAQLEELKRSQAAALPKPSPAPAPAAAVVPPAAARILGLGVNDLNDEARRRYRIKSTTTKGVVITDVEAGSGAADKRLSAGDVIVEIGDRAVASPADVAKRVEQLKKDGSKAALFLLANSDGDLRMVLLPLPEIASVPPVQPAAATTPVQPAAGRLLGLRINSLNDEARRRHGIKSTTTKGVVITDVEAGSGAADKRLSAGDVIVEIGDRAVASPADVAKRVEQLKKDGSKAALFLLANSDGDLRMALLPLQ